MSTAGAGTAVCQLDWTETVDGQRAAVMVAANAGRTGTGTDARLVDRVTGELLYGTVPAG